MRARSPVIVLVEIFPPIFGSSRAGIGANGTGHCSRSQGRALFGYPMATDIVEKNGGQPKIYIHTHDTRIENKNISRPSLPPPPSHRRFIFKIGYESHHNVYNLYARLTITTNEWGV